MKPLTAAARKVGGLFSRRARSAAVRAAPSPVPSDTDIDSLLIGGASAAEEPVLYPGDREYEQRVGVAPTPASPHPAAPAPPARSADPVETDDVPDLDQLLIAATSATAEPVRPVTTPRPVGRVAAPAVDLLDEEIVEAPRIRERVVFRALAALAAVVLALSFVMSLLSAGTLAALLPKAENTLQPNGKVVKGDIPDAIPLPTPPAKMLASDILAYETIDLHPIPGSEDNAAEAIYQTYNINLMALVSTSVYVRVQGYGTDAVAGQALEDLMRQYPLEAKPLKLKQGIQAQSGFKSDSKVMMVAWRTGRYVTYVKSFFQDTGAADPAKSQQILAQLGDPIYRTTALFQTTGMMGTKANNVLYTKKGAKPKPAPKGPPRPSKTIGSVY